MIRFWRFGELDPNYTPGDGSYTDRVDAFFKLAGDRDMRIWMTVIASGRARASDVAVVDDPKTADAWAAALGRGSVPLESVAGVWDPRLRELQRQRIRSLGNHVNKHTGRRWADDPVFAVWELTNEQWWFGHMMGGAFLKLDPFFQKQLYALWTQFLRDKYKTEAALRAAWNGLLPGESLEEGTILLAPLKAEQQADRQRVTLGVNIPVAAEQRVGAADFNRRRGGDVVEFFLKIWIAHKQDQHDLVKSLGMSMRWSPLVWDTGIGYEMPTQFMHQHADAITHCTYVSGFHHDPSHRRFPWYSGLDEPPRLCWDNPWLEQNRYPGKPFFVYETQIHNPAKYRAEFPLRIAALAAIQDWDIVCWHTLGDPPAGGNYDRAMDYSVSQNDAPQGFHYRYDEVQQSVMTAAGTMFRFADLSPAPTPTTFTFGRNSLYSLDMIDYGKAGSRFAPTAWRHGMRLVIDPTQTGDRIDGPSVSTGVFNANPLKPTDQIEIDSQRSFQRIDAPGAASYVGFLADYRSDEVRFEKSDLVLSDVRIVNPPQIAYPVKDDERFFAFTLSTADGQPLANARSAVLSLVSTSFNRDFKLDESKFKKEFVWSWNPGVTVSVGTTPVDVARVGATIRSRSLTGMKYRMLDWRLQPIAEGTVENDTLVIPSDRPVFFVELSRP
jgi:hypothetical protein